MQGQDVWVLQVRRGLDLGEEPIRPDYGGQLRPKHLHRDLAVVPEILREVDGGHAARAELALESVAVRNRSCKILGSAGHHSRKRYFPGGLICVPAAALRHVNELPKLGRARKISMKRAGLRMARRVNYRLTPPSSPIQIRQCAHPRIRVTLDSSRTVDCRGMRQEPVVVACAANATYAIPLTVMLRSATDHLSLGRDLAAWVVDDGLGDAARHRIVESLPSHATVHWLLPTRSDFGGLPLWGRMPINTYDKLTIAECLPAHVSKVIWLDCDTLVLADLAELWDLPMGSAHALAVTDSLVPTVSSRFGVSGFADVGIDASMPYFNAGVMVVDTTKWRASKVAAAAVNYLKRFRDSVFFWDQEALNAVLAGRWSELEPRWNWSANLDRLSRDGTLSHDGKTGSPRIVHFSGNLKPWVVRESMDFDAAYFRVLDETAWHGWRPTRTLARSVLGWYGSSRLRRAVYPAEQWGMQVIHRLTRRHAAIQ